MTWWASAAIGSILGEVNARWPGRSKAADGTIGDARHQAEVSDHNPRPDGEVCAVDITSSGIDAQWLANHLQALSLQGDNRIKYVIYNRHIFSKTVSTAWRDYHGADPHTGHIHLSLNPHAAAAPGWGIAEAPAPAPAPAPHSNGPAWPGRYLKVGFTGADVRQFQGQLAARGWKVSVDGAFGPATDKVVRGFQADKHLGVDGIVGPATWSAAWNTPVT